MLNVKIQFLHDFAKPPSKGSEQAAGWDVYALAPGEVWPRQRKRIPLGFAVELPEGWQAKIKQRSGLFEQYGIITNDSPIDADFRGQLCILAVNTGTNTWRFAAGERIGQLLFEPVPVVRFIRCDELSVTSRGAGGFGSSGK